MSDLATLFAAQGDVKRWQAERENASARLDLARCNEACAYLISQHEPVASLGINREVLRVLLSYVRHADTKRLHRELDELPKE